jgi:hypothetical protein
MIDNYLAQDLPDQRLNNILISCITYLSPLGLPVPFTLALGAHYLYLPVASSWSLRLNSNSKKKGQNIA